MAGWRARLLARSGMPLVGEAHNLENEMAPTNLENEMAPTSDGEEAHDMTIDEEGGGGTPEVVPIQGGTTSAGGVAGVLDGLGLEGVGVEVSLSLSLLLSSLELSDTHVYEPYIRALLGTAAHLCKVVLKLRTVGVEVLPPCP